ncbi:sensor histidine kinase [Pontibacter sp. 13R65]|uniref:sensor histidine kinase n=1 Tax=Pontibacter sp. 13R65 TaxID=3127458 RepID=UPI00301D0585
MDSPYSAASINSFFIDQVKGHAIFATDTNGIITTWNKGAERLKGYTEDEIIGQFYGILHPDKYQQAGKPEEELEQALRDGVYEAEDWRKRKDGTLFWASVMLTPIMSAEGKHIGYTKVTGDLTKQKALQDKLAERQKLVLDAKNNELRKVNMDLTSFIYTASHDLRAPIINIEGLTDLLKQDLKKANCFSPETEFILQGIKDAVIRFKQTVEDLTEINKLQKNITYHHTNDILNIQEEYENVLEDLDYAIAPGSCFMKTDFKVHQLKFPKKSFRSILYNLLSNAVKYQAPDRECIIKTHSWLEEPYVVLGIKDNGLGISKHQQEQLYTMFKRFHDHVEGSGIGLYMVKKIIEQAGGKIEEESEEGSGTFFRVYFQAAI